MVVAFVLKSLKMVVEEKAVVVVEVVVLVMAAVRVKDVEVMEVAIVVAVVEEVIVHAAEVAAEAEAVAVIVAPHRENARVVEVNRKAVHEKKNSLSGNLKIAAIKYASVNSDH
jgi:hypothetical protein